MATHAAFGRGEILSLDLASTGAQPGTQYTHEVGGATGGAVQCKLDPGCSDLKYMYSVPVCTCLCYRGMRRRCKLSTPAFKSTPSAWSVSNTL